MYFLDCVAVEEEGEADMPVRLFSDAEYGECFYLSTTRDEERGGEGGAE